MSTVLHNLMSEVESANPYVVDDFVADSFALIALALSKLPERERESELQGIEEGELRRAVEKFYRPSPYPQTGKGGAR